MLSESPVSVSPFRAFALQSFSINQPGTKEIIIVLEREAVSRSVLGRVKEGRPDTGARFSIKSINLRIYIDSLTRVNRFG